VQLSINQDKGFDYHLEVGAKLASLRERGVLVIGSGNVVHNLGGMNWKQPDAGFDWAQRFDEEAKARMVTDPTEVARMDAHADFRLAVPTPDHFIPLLYLAGLAGAAGGGTDVLVDGYTYGSLSMTAYTLGMAISPPSAPQDAAVPAPADAPPDASNI
jgi:4,5-DOPA dioxygenase extradiol